MFYLKTILHSSSMEEGGKAGVREGAGKEGRREFMRVMETWRQREPGGRKDGKSNHFFTASK